MGNNCTSCYLYYSNKQHICSLCKENITFKDIKNFDVLSCKCGDTTHYRCDIKMDKFLTTTKENGELVKVKIEGYSFCLHCNQAGYIATGF